MFVHTSVHKYTNTIYTSTPDIVVALNHVRPLTLAILAHTGSVCIVRMQWIVDSCKYSWLDLWHSQVDFACDIHVSK